MFAGFRRDKGKWKFIYTEYNMTITEYSNCIVIKGSHSEYVLFRDNRNRNKQDVNIL